MSKVDVQDVPIDYELLYVRHRVSPINPTDVQCMELGILSVTRLSATSVRVDFDAPALNNTALVDPDNYIFTRDTPLIDPRTSLPVSLVVPEGVTNPTYVILTTAEQTTDQDYLLDIRTVEAA